MASPSRPAAGGGARAGAGAAAALARSAAGARQPARRLAGAARTSAGAAAGGRRRRGPGGLPDGRRRRDRGLGAAGIGAGAAAAAPRGAAPTPAAVANCTGCGGGSGFSCAPRSKISPGPGWILVVGERGAACSNSFDSSNSEMRRPAFALSPRTRISRCGSLPFAVLFISNCVSQVSSGRSLVTSSTDCSALGKGVFLLQREVVIAGEPLELLAQRARRVGLRARLVGELHAARWRTRASARGGAPWRRAPPPRSARAAPRSPSGAATTLPAARPPGSRFSAVPASSAAPVGRSGVTATTVAPQLSARRRI